MTLSEKVVIQPSPFGPVAVVWSLFPDRPKIVRILLSGPHVSAKGQVSRLFPNHQASSCIEIAAVVKDVEVFLNGHNVRFSLDAARMDSCSTFQQSVLRAVHRIPRGSTSTYRRLAEQLGRPNGARAVGNSLANNPFPILVPCHRVIRSNRTLGRYQGGFEMKRALLEAENICIMA